MNMFHSLNNSLNADILIRQSLLIVSIDILKKKKLKQCIMMQTPPAYFSLQL